MTLFATKTFPCSCVDLRLLLEEQLKRISAKQTTNVCVLFDSCEVIITSILFIVCHTDLSGCELDLEELSELLMFDDGRVLRDICYV